jgi:hypothetical protein
MSIMYFLNKITALLDIFEKFACSYVLQLSLGELTLYENALHLL